MARRNRRLTEKQQLAIIEMVKPSNKTFTQVADKLGVSVRTLYSWRKRPEFEKGLSVALSELRERIYSALEYSEKTHALNSMLDIEFKLISSLDVASAIIALSKNQERLRARLTVLEEEVEQLKNKP